MLNLIEKIIDDAIIEKEIHLSNIENKVKLIEQKYEKVETEHESFVEGYKQKKAELNEKLIKEYEKIIVRFLKEKINLWTANKSVHNRNIYISEKEYSIGLNPIG